MTFSSTRVLVPLALLTVLSACSWFHGGSKTDYKHSTEAPPLEVPPGLDAPPRGAELTIPGDESHHAPEHAPEHAAATAPITDSNTTAGGTKPAYIGTETSLVLQDDVTSSFHRIGLALGRTDVVKVIASDEVAATYTVTKQTLVENKHWYQRFLGSGAKPETLTRVVRVVPEGQGARVQVEDESGREIRDTSAREIIGALKTRLE
jgi:uncharacterized lipoprotein